MAAIRLPSWWCSSRARIETGTSARSSSPSVRRPRERSHFCSAPATALRTTSLTVPPSASLTRLKSARSCRTQTSRRCGPISTLSGVGGAGFSAAQTTSPMPSSASRVSCSASLGCAAAPSARAPASNGRLSRPRTPRAASSTRLGVGRGAHGASGCPISDGTGERSKSTVARSTPATPSTSAWWVLVMSAKRSPSRPWTSHSSHSGLERSSAWEWIRAASARSCASDPGAGSAVSRTWYSRLKLASSTHSGRPVSTGGKASFWRKRGHEVQAPADVVGELLVAGRRARRRSSPRRCACARWGPPARRTTHRPRSTGLRAAAPSPCLLVRQGLTLSL